MAALLGLIAGVCGIGSLVCFILVLIKMFQNEQVALGIVCIVFCGVGAVIAFIMGWVNASKWNIQNVMWAWTGCAVVGFIAGALM